MKTPRPIPRPAVTANITLCTLFTFVIVYFKNPPIIVPKVNIPAITPMQKTAIKTRPITEELTVDKVTSIIAALPLKPWIIPEIKDFCS